MFNSVFERITYLEYQLQAKKALIDAFESGVCSNAGGIS